MLNQISEERNCEKNWEEQIRRYIGETVTIFTTSGGESGIGFTGVVILVNHNFVRLITHLGMAPACPLGSDCSDSFDMEKRCNHNKNGVGSITDIPIDKIAAFVHNAVSNNY
jgi:hypothetical protein